MIVRETSDRTFTLQLLCPGYGDSGGHVPARLPCVGTAFCLLLDLTCLGRKKDGRGGLLLRTLLPVKLGPEPLNRPPPRPSGATDLTAASTTRLVTGRRSRRAWAGEMGDGIGPDHDAVRHLQCSAREPKMDRCPIALGDGARGGDPVLFRSLDLGIPSDATLIIHKGLMRVKTFLQILFQVTGD